MDNQRGCSVTAQDRRSSQGAPLSCDIAAKAAVEQLNGMLRYAIGLEFGEDAPGISWSEAAARRIGGEELKRWPALVRIWAFSDFDDYAEIQFATQERCERCGGTAQ